MSVIQPNTFFQRVAEHKNSAIGKHFHEAHGRRDRLNESHFKILRKCQGKFDCLVFEMLYIKKFKPNLLQTIVLILLPCIVSIPNFAHS